MRCEFLEFKLLSYLKNNNKDLSKFNAGVVVRVCEPTYSTDRL